MSSIAKHRDYWTKAKRVVSHEGRPTVKETVCCCALPLAARKDCALVAGNKTPCRCYCHSTKIAPSDTYNGGPVT